MAEVFPIVPASAKPLWFLGAICALLLAVFGALAYTAWSARNSRVEVVAGELRVVGDFWGRSVPLTSLVLDRAEIVDVGGASPLRPRRRTLGTGMPGYASGWFRLANGEKALVYLTRRDAVVYLPTSLDFSLLLSVERPRELLAALGAGAGSGSERW